MSRYSTAVDESTQIGEKKMDL